MASILRSSKFVRYIAGFARNIVVNGPREFDGNFANSSQCFCGAIQNAFATQASAQHEQTLERRLRTIDQDVRRSGRISRRDIEDVLEEIRNTRSATSSQSLLVIRCCGNLVPDEQPEVRTKLVQEIWNTLKKLNVPMDVSHYNALLRVYLENEHQFSPTEFLAEMESKGIEPNRVTYQRLIAQYCQNADIEGATRILEFMKEKQMPVNENVFNALINGHSEAGDMDSARGILSVMAQAGLEPSADTYTTLICGYAKKGDINTITQLLDECESKEIYLLDKDYLDIIYALSDHGHKEHAPVILEKTRRGFGYNQDAINLILRLINKGDEETAYAVLKSMPRGTNDDGTLMPMGNFFIRQLVKANRPIEKIISYCDQLEKDELYQNGLVFATEITLQLGNEQLAFKLLAELHKRGHVIKHHYFWPLLAAKGNVGDEEKLIDVLLEMQKYTIPNLETLKDYVLPYMTGKSTDIIAKLRLANISAGSAAASLVVTSLGKNAIEEAAFLASTVPAYYYPDTLKKPLVSAYYSTKNIDCFMTILRMMQENCKRRSEGETLDEVAIAGKILMELMANKRSFLEVAHEVFSKFVEHGLTITTTCAEVAQEKLGEKMTPEISDMLGKLTSGDLTPIPVVKQPPSYVPAQKMNIPQLERLISNLAAKGQNTLSLKKQLMNLYYRAKQLDKMEALLPEMEKEGYVPNSGVLAQFLDMYAFNENLDKALEMEQKLREIEPTFSLDATKVVRLAYLLITKGRYDEALEKLRNINVREKKSEDPSFVYTNLVWKLLNYLAEQGDADKVEEVFNIMISKEYIQVNNSMLGPLVKVHIVNNDIEAALNKLEWCVNQFQLTPWKNELACKLIQAEDAEKLQRITDLSTKVHGEINSLYDLVFSFVDCGRIRQARKILETPGLQSRPHRLNTICLRYKNEGNVQSLEGLKDATKDLSHIDRSDIYYQLLLTYIKKNEDQKALGLWTQMQDEDVIPTDDFLKTLGSYLKDKGLEVPFAIPEDKPVKILKRPASSKQKQETQVNQERGLNQEKVNQGKTNFKGQPSTLKQLLRTGEVDKALQIAKSDKEQVNSADVSSLIEKLVQENRMEEAANLAKNMLDANAQPVLRVFRFLLNKLANNGELHLIEELGKRLSADMKKQVSYDNKLCHANIVNGKADEYLGQLEKEIETAKEEELALLGEKFPRGGAVGILERHPHLTNQYENLAIKYAERGIIAPVNVLWSHYFINNKDAEAEKLWEQYLQGAQRIMFQRVVQQAREVKDENLITKLISHLKKSKVTEGAIGNAYSCLLDVLYAKEMMDETLATFEKALKDISIDYLNRTAVLRVKDVHEKLGKPFEHRIPAKKDKNAVGASDDD